MNTNTEAAGLRPPSRMGGRGPFVADKTEVRLVPASVIFRPKQIASAGVAENVAEFQIHIGKHIGIPFAGP